MHSGAGEPGTEATYDLLLVVLLHIPKLFPQYGEPGNETTLYLVQLQHELLMHIPALAEEGTSLNLFLNYKST